MGIAGKRVLVTGACGTVGSELIRQLLTDDRFGPAEVIGVDNDESALFFQDQAYLNDLRARFALADMRDRDRLLHISRGVDTIFHAAALKHVVMCERSPMEAVQTNILGVENIVAAARDNKVGTVIFTSSDKAVNPTNVMGTSKLMGERLITAANSTKHGDGPIFASTRFGNVLGSSGSVVPIFRRQIASGGPVTLTDPGMTRFIMSIEQAVRLVIESCELARGGEVFVTKMPVIRISDLAKVMIEELAPRYGHAADKIEISVIGTNPGEKLYEELMSNEETRRAIELERYFSITPAFTGLYHHIEYDYEGIVSREIKNAYNSAHEAPLETDALREFLRTHKLLEPEIGIERDMSRRYWPGDKEERTQ
jgi:FlaA1/EpsC-like NDP-sugar epimerase